MCEKGGRKSGVSLHPNRYRKKQKGGTPRGVYKAINSSYRTYGCIYSAESQQKQKSFILIQLSQCFRDLSRPLLSSSGFVHPFHPLAIPFFQLMTIRVDTTAAYQMFPSLFALFFFRPSCDVSLYLIFQKFEFLKIRDTCNPQTLLLLKLCPMRILFSSSDKSTQRFFQSFTTAMF